jgi:hypothetical protein
MVVLGMLALSWLAVVLVIYGRMSYCTTFGDSLRLRSPEYGRAGWLWGSMTLPGAMEANIAKAFGEQHTISCGCSKRNESCDVCNNCLLFLRLKSLRFAVDICAGNSSLVLAHDHMLLVL